MHCFKKADVTCCNLFISSKCSVITVALLIEFLALLFWLIMHKSSLLTFCNLRTKLANLLFKTHLPHLHPLENNPLCLSVYFMCRCCTSLLTLCDFALSQKKVDNCQSKNPSIQVVLLHFQNTRASRWRVAACSWVFWFILCTNILPAPSDMPLNWHHAVIQAATKSLVNLNLVT